MSLYIEGNGHFHLTRSNDSLNILKSKDYFPSTIINSNQKNLMVKTYKKVIGTYYKEIINSTYKIYDYWYKHVTPKDFINDISAGAIGFIVCKDPYNENTFVFPLGISNGSIPGSYSIYHTRGFNSYDISDIKFYLGTDHVPDQAKYRSPLHPTEITFYSFTVSSIFYNDTTIGKGTLRSGYFNFSESSYLTRGKHNNVDSTISDPIVGTMQFLNSFYNSSEYTGLILNNKEIQAQFKNREPYTVIPSGSSLIIPKYDPTIYNSKSASISHASFAHYVILPYHPDGTIALLTINVPSRGIISQVPIKYGTSSNVVKHVWSKGSGWTCKWSSGYNGGTRYDFYGPFNVKITLI